MLTEKNFKIVYILIIRYVVDSNYNSSIDANIMLN